MAKKSETKEDSLKDKDEDSNQSVHMKRSPITKWDLDRRRHGENDLNRRESCHEALKNPLVVPGDKTGTILGLLPIC